MAFFWPSVVHKTSQQPQCQGVVGMNGPFPDTRRNGLFMMLSLSRISGRWDSESLSLAPKHAVDVPPGRGAGASRRGGFLSPVQGSLGFAPRRVRCAERPPSLQMSSWQVGGGPRGGQLSLRADRGARLMGFVRGKGPMCFLTPCEWDPFRPQAGGRHGDSATLSVSHYSC